MVALLPHDEISRLAALYRYQILDTEAEPAFDDLTTLAAHICETPIALVSLVDRDRQWFKSKTGLCASETSRDLAFCAHAILDQIPFIVEDTLADDRFADNSLVTGEPYIRFYAGVPLVSPDCYPLGTLCVIDRVPRQLNSVQLSALQALSRQVVNLLELRRNLAERQQAESLLVDQKRILEMIARGAPLIDVLNTLIRAIESKSAGMIGSILLVNAEGTHLKHGTAPNLPKDYFQVADGLEIGPNNGSCGRAACIGEPVIVSDIANSPLWAAHRDFVLSYQLRACWSTPIISSSGQVLGTFAMYYREPRSPNTHDQGLIEVAVHLAAIAIEREQAQEQLQRDLIVRRQVEESLQESKEQLHFILQNMPVMLDAVDDKWNIVFWNQECERVTGYQASEIINNPKALEVAYPDLIYRQQMIDNWMRQGNNYRNWEWNITCKDGSIRTIAWSNISEQFPIPGWASWGIGVDITERKQAEAALRQQAERERLVSTISQRIRQSLDLHQTLNTTVSEVRQLLQADRVLTYRVSGDGIRCVTNEAVAPDYLPLLDQVLPAEVIPSKSLELCRQGQVQAFTDIEQEDFAPEIVATLQRLGVRSKLVVPILYKDELWGLLIVHQCSQRREWQPSEIELLQQLSIQVAIAIHQSELYEQTQIELAERKRAEQKVREQAALLNITTDAILVRNLSHQIVFWNKGAERLYGWLAAEAHGKKATELLYHNLPTNSEEIYQTVLDQGLWQGELHQSTKTGQEVIVESRWTLVRDLQGAPQAILMVNTDITQKKQLERQFLRAQRMESIGTLAGGIAHDLNNVLAPILMSVPLLEAQLRDPNDLKSRQWLDIVESSARRGSNLVKQVLSFARGVEGEKTLLEIKHLIWEIREIAEETFPKSITFSTNLSRDLWLIHGDATQLHQILLNLCVNARDAMPRGGLLQISAQNLILGDQDVQLHIDAKVGPYVVITVSDTGIGIPEEMSDRIFDPFFTTKEIGKGTGLGLSTVLSITKNHQGFITFSSEVGMGTAFKVYLPAILESENLKTTETNLLAGANQVVLVVDDEVSIRAITKTTLENHGYRALTASNGLEAISLYTQHQHEIQVVLIDLMMAGMDGPDVIRGLRTMSSGVKIIATSGLNLPDQLAGMPVEEFLQKPFTTPELLATLYHVLS